MNLHLKVWRQKNAATNGSLVSYEARDIPEDCSFLEMLDLVNEDLLSRGEEPVAFDHDCREGICGMCSLTINGIPHGPSETTTCQLYMRKFKDGETIYIEPFRASAFPVLRDLAVNRSALDRIQRAGGFISAHVGSAPDGNAILVPKTAADQA
ncbi:MAG: succinate dehydrogenase/fumarate reductase iron-sulfur subunit, partial [Verrucomicrobiota bacterium]